MPVFKINHQTGYTVMSNYHLRDKNLSYKAKGLLSFMLTLPKDWDYSVNGLVKLSKEGLKAVRSMLKELEENNYLIREKVRDEYGKFDYEYNIYEKPYSHFGHSDKGNAEKDTQINTNKQNTNYKDKNDKPGPLVSELINNNFISSSDLNILYYNDILNNALEEYKYHDVIRVLNYIINKWKENNGYDENGNKIINKYGYFKSALINNLRKINTDIELDY